MEEADLSFASLLLALRNSSDDLDLKDSVRQKPTLNFHRDFYQNSSYDNECSTAAESLTTLSSYSTDIDSPMGNEFDRSQQVSSIGWKRRSEPCVGIAGLVENYPFSSTYGNLNGSASELCEFSFSQIRNQGQGSVDNQRASGRANQNQNKEKKLCRQSSHKYGPDGQIIRQQRNKMNQSELSHDDDNKSSFKAKDDEKDLIQINGINRIKGNRDQKSVNSKKSEKDERDKEREALKERKSKILHSSSGESHGTGSGREVGIDCILLEGNDNGVERSIEEQKEIDDCNEARLLKIARGRYKCSRCGALKTNHDCPIIEEYAGSVATQIEKITLRSEEFLSGGMAGFSAALKTCNLLTVRSNYKPHAQHTHSINSHSNSNNCGHPDSTPVSRSESFIAGSRSLSYNALVGANRGNAYGNDTDNNTTNSNSDNDSDSLAAKDSDTASTTSQSNSNNQYQSTAMANISPRPIMDCNPRFTNSNSMYAQSQLSSSAGVPLRSHSMPSSESLHLAAMSAINLSNMEGRMNGLHAYSIPNSNRNDRYPPSIRRSLSGNVDQKDPRGTAYNIIYQSLPYLGPNNGSHTVHSSSREYSIPMPL